MKIDYLRKDGNGNYWLEKAVEQTFDGKVIMASVRYEIDKGIKDVDAVLNLRCVCICTGCTKEGNSILRSITVMTDDGKTFISRGVNGDNREWPASWHAPVY